MKKLFFALLFFVGFLTQAQYKQANTIPIIAEENFGKTDPNQAPVIILHNGYTASMWKMVPNDTKTPASATVKIHPSKIRFRQVTFLGTLGGSGGGSTSGSILLQQISDLSSIWPPTFSVITQKPSSYPSDWNTTLNRPNLNLKSDSTHRHTTAHITIGTWPTARFAAATIPVNSLITSGSTADTAFLRRDGTWVAITQGTGGSSGLADPAANGILSRTGSGVTTSRTLSVSGAGLSVTNGTGVSGNPTYSLINDVGAIEALTGTGFAKRTGTDTWAVGAVDLASDVTGTLPNSSLASALTGKTYNGLTLSTTTGTFSLTNGKTFSIANTLTFSGTDGSSLNIGSGGTLNSLAFLGSVNNSNWSGTALSVGNGGSGQTTAQASMNIFAGAVTSGLFLRGNGSNVVMGAIQAGDLPSAIDATKIGGGAVSNTEISYVDGVTSAIQPQINNKQPNIQYQKDATNKGSAGGVSTINYVGNGVKIVNSSGTNTITIQKDYVTLEEFGGAADGTTDNYAAFNSAKATGKKILLAPGTYLTTRTWLIDQDGVELIGSGKFTTKVMPKSGFLSTDSSLIKIGSAAYRPANVSIRDMTVVANAGTPGINVSGICVDADFNIDIVNCWLLGGDYDTRAAAAVKIKQSKHLRFTSCNLTNSTSYGILVMGSAFDDTSFLDCQFDENQADFVVTNTGYAQRVTFTDCKFAHTYDNTLYPCPVKHVNIKNTTANTIDHIEITNCSFFNNNSTSPTLTAIDLLTPITATIRNCSFYNLRKNAIVNRYGGKFYIQNNRFNNSGRARTDNDPEDGTNNPDTSPYTSDIFFYTGFFGGAITNNVSDNANMGWIESNLSDVQYLYTKIENNRIYAHKRYFGLTETATAAPTDVAKNYVAGEYVKNSAPSELGTTPNKYIIKGWTCITSGYPGTWVQDRALTGN